MKRATALLLAAVILTGCTPKNEALEQALKLRTKLLRTNTASFTTDIVADYGDKQQFFTLDCTADGEGTVSFRVVRPGSIEGIEGRIDGEDGRLTFGETALFFPLLADGQVTPVCAPWLFYKTLRSGYITSAGTSGDLTLVSIDDSYREDALHLDIWLNSSGIPVRSEILYRERKILSLDVKDFRME